MFYIFMIFEKSQGGGEFITECTHAQARYLVALLSAAKGKLHDYEELDEREHDMFDRGDYFTMIDYDVWVNDYTEVN